MSAGQNTPMTRTCLFYTVFMGIARLFYKKFSRIFPCFRSFPGAGLGEYAGRFFSPAALGASEDPPGPLQRRTGGSHMNRPFRAARSFNRQAHGDKPPSLGLLLFPFFPKRTERPRSFDHRRMVQPRVFAARCKELLVCAALADAVLVDDDDLVRMLDR